MRSYEPLFGQNNNDLLCAQFNLRVGIVYLFPNAQLQTLEIGAVQPTIYRSVF